MQRDSNWKRIASVAMACTSATLLWAQAAVGSDPHDGGAPTEAALLRVYTAKRVITMDPSLPHATAVAVAEGRIVAVGSLASMQPWLDAREHTIDTTFAKKILLPGFVENHLHPIMAAVLLPMEFVTPHDWSLPGREVQGVQGHEAYVARLRELEARMEDPAKPLFAWGYHQLFHGVLSRSDLDAISGTRPIIAWHRSFHEIIANTAALEWMGITEQDVAGHHQVDFARGHFFETGLRVAVAKLMPTIFAPAWIDRGMNLLAETVHAGGITTVGDMAAGVFNLELEWAAQKRTLDREDTPFRVALIPDANSLGVLMGHERALATIQALPERNTHRLRFVHAVKLFADGAFFSQLMQLGPPGYIDGHHGEWLMTPEQLREAAELYWNAGYQIHVHVNGDRGVDVTLDVLEALLNAHPRVDHRFTLHHYGYSTTAQARRVAALGALVSANPYYLWSMGDAYAQHGLGPERASELVRLGSLVRNGVSVSLHSDFTMAPARPLLLAWVAANRRTADDVLMGPEERLTLDQALRAVTIDAAHALRMDHEIGSIVAGKKADFTVLERDPYATAVTRLKDIDIWGTVFEGQPFPITK